MNGPEARRREISRVADLPKFHELKPTQSVVDALRGEISIPTLTESRKPRHEGEIVEVRLASEGPGLFGLTDYKDSQLWSGIFNHSVLSARYSLYFVAELTKRGHKINSQRILDGMIVSHTGRRQWEEVKFYPDAVRKELARIGKDPMEFDKRKGISNELIGLRLIRGKVPQDVFDLVSALAHENTEFPVSPEVYDSLEYRITEYVDHRTTHTYLPLSSRMGDFMIGNFFNTQNLTLELIEKLKEKVYEFTRSIIERRKAFYLKKSEQEVTLEQADQEAEELGASADSDRLKRIDLIRLILHDAVTEAFLESEEINPDGLSDETVPMPRWEIDLRKAYVESARTEIRDTIDAGDLEIDINNPKDWWEQFVVRAAGNE